jgi:hypothetical protein
MRIGDHFVAPQATGQVIPVADVECLPPCRPGQISGLRNNVRAAADRNG